MPNRYEMLVAEVAKWGLGLNVEQLAAKMFFLFYIDAATGRETDCYLINDRYLHLDGVDYKFKKSRKLDAWVVCVR